jgi:hypothetical protein
MTFTQTREWVKKLPLSNNDQILPDTIWLIKENLDLVDVWKILYLKYFRKISHEPGGIFKRICFLNDGKSYVARTTTCFHFLTRNKKQAYCVYIDQDKKIQIREHRVLKCPDSEYKELE